MEIYIYIYMSFKQKITKRYLIFKIVKKMSLAKSLRSRLKQEVSRNLMTSTPFYVELVRKVKIR